MKIFRLLTIFISLAFVGLGCYLIVKSAPELDTSYLIVAKAVLGGILALMGAMLLLATVIATATDKLNKHRMKKRRGRK